MKRAKENAPEKKSGRALLWGLGALLLLALPASLMLGRYAVSPVSAARILLGRLPFFHTEGLFTQAEEAAVLGVRLPRMLLAVMTGAALSASGAVLQSVFMNPLASPDLLGASSSAGFGAALAIFLGLTGFAVTGMAFLFGLMGVALVFLAGTRVRGNRSSGLILCGIIVGSLFSAGISLIKLSADPENRLPAITYWLMGSLNGADMKTVRFFALPLAAGTVPLLLLRWKLNVISLGDDAARAVGADPGRIRAAAVLCTSLLTAAAVSSAGVIGWVGLVVPQALRRLTGPDQRSLLPASLLAGGLFMLASDTVSRCLLAAEVPVGIVTALIGAPAFLILLITERRRNNA